MTGSPYTWSGDLAEFNIVALYAACGSLRFTGQLELRDENRQAQIIFLGGDPVEIDGGDTKAIALWNGGTFRAVQSLPNLTGELTGQIEQTGSLAVTKAPRLLAWVSEYRLTCDLKIERPGENAQLSFRNGQLEAAEVNGKPELAALARVQTWTDGFYRVNLRPLFADGVHALAPQPSGGAAPAGREFDVSRSIPLDLKHKAKLLPTPVGTLTVGETSIEAERAAVRSGSMPRLSSTDPAVTAQPREPVVETTATSIAMPAPKRGSRLPLVLVGLLCIGAVGLGAAYKLHLPPFSPPPRPLDEPSDKPSDKPSVQAEVKPDMLAPKPAPALEPKPATPEKKPELAVVDAPKSNKKPANIDPAALDPKSDAPHVEMQGTAPLDQRLIEKGRLLLLDGHPHSAISLFRKAEQTNPKNPLVKILQQQALGKLGRAELSIEGRGTITIDGKRFDAPKKVKLYAGPHAIDNGAGAEELVLKKNEHKKLRAHP
jgi:hypothetical protein